MTEELTNDEQQKLAQLQMLEQARQQVLMQKQNINAQVMEIEVAINELGKTDEAYKMVSTIMVKTNKEDLLKELKDEKELKEKQMEKIEKQESQTTEKIKKIREEVMKKIKG